MRGVVLLPAQRDAGFGAGAAVLQRVGQQIAPNLAQQHRVAVHLRKVVRYLPDHLAALGLSLDALARLSHQQAHGDGHFVEVGAAQAGQIKQTVDQPPHVADRMVHLVQRRHELLAVALVGGLAAQLDVVADLAQRRAQVVRDGVREALQLIVCGLELLGALLHPVFQLGVQVLLQVLGLADFRQIVDQASKAQHVPGGITQRRDQRVRPEAAAVLARDPVVGFKVAGVAGLVQALVGQRLRVVAGFQQLGQGRDLFGAVAMQAVRAGAPVGDAALRIGEVDAVVLYAFDHQAKAFFARHQFGRALAYRQLQIAVDALQRVFGLAPGRDVDHGHAAVDEAALKVDHRADVEQGGEAATVLAPDLVFLLFGAAPGQQPAEQQVEAVLIRLVQQAAKKQLTEHLFARQAQPLQGGLVHAFKAAFDVQRQIAAGRVLVQVVDLQQRVVQLVVGADQVLRALFDALLQLGIEFANLLLAQVQFGDVARHRQQHVDLAGVVAHGRDHGVPPFGRALERVAKRREAHGAAFARADQRIAHRRALRRLPDAEPVHPQQLDRVVQLQQAAGGLAELLDAPVQREHQQAVVPTAHDDAVQTVLVHREVARERTVSGRHAHVLMYACQPQAAVFFCGRFQLEICNCLARSITRVPGGESLVTVEPPPTVLARPMVTGATSTQLLPMCTSSSITVRCLLAPS